MGNVLALGYSGPPMRRPVASNEVRWLARALVQASDAANAALGLDQPPAQAEQQRGDALQVRPAALSRMRNRSMAPPLLARCWRALHEAERLVQLRCNSSCPRTAVGCLPSQSEGVQCTIAVLSGQAHTALALGVFTVCWGLCAASQGLHAAERGHQPAQPLGHLLGGAADAVLRTHASRSTVAAVEAPGARLGDYHPTA